jgi:hypothetical protein
MPSNKTEIQNQLLKRKKPQENLNEPCKLEKISQTHNSLNSRLGLNREAQFLANLILISQSKSNKEQQLKKYRKPGLFLKLVGNLTANKQIKIILNKINNN